MTQKLCFPSHHAEHVHRDHAEDERQLPVATLTDLRQVQDMGGIDQADDQEPERRETGGDGPRQDQQRPRRKQAPGVRTCLVGLPVHGKEGTEEHRRGRQQHARQQRLRPPQCGRCACAHRRREAHLGEAPERGPVEREERDHTGEHQACAEQQQRGSQETPPFGLARRARCHRPHLAARGIRDANRVEHEVDVRRRRGAIERVRSG